VLGLSQSLNYEDDVNDEVEIDDDDPIPITSNKPNSIDSWITKVCTPQSNMETVRLSTPSIVSSITSTSSKLSSCSSTASFSLGNENKALSSMTNFVDKLTDNEKKELDSMLSKAIYSSGSPLSLLQNLYWKKLFVKIRPAYVLPTPYQLSNKLLNDEVESIKVFVENLIIGADCLGLMCDGWSNIRNESIINFVITTPKPVFYKSLPTLTQRHTGNYMANVMIDLIEEVGPGKFYGIVTDNAANMKKAWQEINQKYAHITTYGCIAHSLSLLINYIISLESLKSAVKDGVTIFNNIRRGHVLHAVFKEKQTELDIKKSLMLPVQTRWGYVVVFLNSLLSNKQIIRLLNIDERCEKDISQRVKQLITNDIFWDKLKNLHNFLKPIAYWITKIESDDPQMSVIPEIFI